MNSSSSAAGRLGPASSPGKEMLRLSRSRVYLVPVIMRTLDILELLSTGGAPRRMNEIAEIVGVPRTTTYRILRTLAHRGYISQDIEGRFSSKDPANQKIVPIRLDDPHSALRGKAQVDPDFSPEQLVETAIALLQGLRQGKAKQTSRK